MALPCYLRAAFTTRFVYKGHARPPTIDSPRRQRQSLITGLEHWTTFFDKFLSLLLHCW